jgi:hypothetical protein
MLRRPRSDNARSLNYSRGSDVYCTTDARDRGGRMKEPVSEQPPQAGSPDSEMLVRPDAPTGSLRPPPIAVLCNRAAIQAMAEELGRPLNEVARVYCEELAHLRTQAKVLDYLHVLVAKRVRALYGKV